MLKKKTKGMMPDTLPCKICGKLPHIPAPVPDGDNSHHQILCLECGIEVIRLSAQDAADIWNKLARASHASGSYPSSWPS